MSDPRDIDPVYNSRLQPTKFNAKIRAPTAITPKEQQQDKEQGVGLGWKWWRFARRYKASNPYCAHCGLLGQELHHILPRATHAHLMYDYDNLLHLCHDCHTEHHRKNPV